MSKQNPHDTAGALGAPFHIVLCQHGKGISPAPQQQNQIKILYVLRGLLLVEVNGSSYEVSPGNLFVILADEPHRISSPAKEDTTFWKIEYDKELLYSASQSASDNQFLFSFATCGLFGQRLFDRNTLAENHISSLIEDMLAEYEGSEFCSDVAVRLYLGGISLWLLRNWKTADDEKNLTGNNDVYSMNLLQKIFAYVDSEYMNKIKMETIANLCNMSYHSFSKFFIAHTGKTFPGYVNEVRLTKSKILLTTTGMNITEIALEVGYITTSHFIQRFKESNKMTPQQFRKEFNHKTT